MVCTDNTIVPMLNTGKTANARMWVDDYLGSRRRRRGLLAPEHVAKQTSQCRTLP